jgi:hypothetical protein
MTKHMADAMNLPSLEDALREHGINPVEPLDMETPAPQWDDEPQEVMSIDAGVMNSFDAAEAAAKRLTEAGGEDHERSMDLLFKETLEKARDMVELAYNVDQNRSRGILEVAGQFYRTALDAKNSKRDAQLKLMKLALDQRRLALDEKKASQNTPEATDADASVVVIGDRNDILARAREMAAAKKKT